MMAQDNVPDRWPVNVFERKVRLSRAALYFERLWPRLWYLLAVAGLFLIASFGGIFSLLDPLTHQALLLAFAALGGVAALYAMATRYPLREDAIRRMERRSGAVHRPASSYEDTVSASMLDPASAALWSAHRDRLRRSIEALRIGHPDPRTDRVDPIALRSAVVIAIAATAGLAGSTLFERMAEAFKFDRSGAAKAMRIDAWVTPPPYTAIPPIMLADSSAAAAENVAKPRANLIEAPEKSILTLRGADLGGRALTLEVLGVGADKPEIVTPKVSQAGTAGSIADPTADAASPVEIRYDLTAPARIRVLAAGQEMSSWTFDVIPDQKPRITIENEAFSSTPRGSMKLAYKTDDDYGVASAVAKVRPVDPSKDDILRSSRRHATKLKGPRLPLSRPPVLPLKLSRAGAKSTDGTTLLELGPHPWAGQKVIMWLEATDVAGQTGASDGIEIVLPSRRFSKPLARAVIEQRAKLVEDSRNRPDVLVALDALMLEPDGFIDSTKVYLGLRTAYYRLQRDTGVLGMASVIDQLWQVALQIEDGAASEAERALKDAQDKLSKALEDGASDEELQKLMQELKQAMQEYMQELQKQAEQDPEQLENDGSEDEIGQQDLQDMMQQLEETARNGSREEAEKMLSDLRELMDRMQAQKSGQNKEQQARNKQMRKKMDELGDLVGQQKRLMDDTFGEQRQRDRQDQGQGEEGQQQPGLGERGMRGEQGQSGQEGMESQQGQGQQQGAQGRQQGGRGKSGQQGSLAERQARLREQLDKLKKELQELGSGSDKFNDAQGAMEEAERQLGQEQLGEAAREQANALDQMRQGAQQMMQDMMQQGQDRMGQNGKTPRDPLGRPQRAQGPDLGTSVKVPDQIDAQRAREILDELRRRSGEALRPAIELDYIDRLLRRF